MKLTKTQLAGLIEIAKQVDFYAQNKPTTGYTLRGCAAYSTIDSLISKGLVVPCDHGFLNIAARFKISEEGRKLIAAAPAPAPKPAAAPAPKPSPLAPFAKAKPANTDSKPLQLTHVNLWALADEIRAGKGEIFRVKSVSAPHIRRCILAGALETTGIDKHWKLTDLGRDLLAADGHKVDY
jgi:hypothetical protein